MKPHAEVGLALRLFVAIALVVLAGAVTLLTVSLLVAPAMFRWHLGTVGVQLDADTSRHVEDGFVLAVLTGLGAGVTAATLVAIAVSAVVARRITRAVAVVASAARRLAEGDYARRVKPPLMGPELVDLADAVNTLADRLEDTEHHRQQLMTDVAHELRTPLASLEATVEAVVDGVLPFDDRTAAALTEQTRRLSRLTRDLAAVSRSQEHAFTVVRTTLDLTALARACLATHAARYAASGVGLSLVAPQPVPALADGDRVTEILDQLLDNALRHCRAGATVTVAVSADGDHASLTVTDTGEGFPPDEAPRLFRRFHRLHRDTTSGSGGRGADAARSAGAGVGLTIARALAEAMDGTLDASSPGPGHGAALALNLPRKP